MIGERLKEVRNLLGLTQEKMGAPIGLSKANIRDLESGKVKISTIHTLAFEYVYKINSKWLITGVGEKIVDNYRPDYVSEPVPQYNDDKTIKENEVLKYLEIVEAEHAKLIKGFKDKERGKRLNEKLIRLEQISENQIDKIEHEIDLRLEIAEDVIGDIKNTMPSETKSYGRAGGDRRRPDEHGQWDGVERRKKA